MVEKFEVGKKYKHITSNEVCVCTVITPYGNPVVQFFSTKSESIVHKTQYNYYIEYVEPPLAVGDVVYRVNIGTKYTILAIDGRTVWAKHKSGGYTQQDISLFERV